MSGIKSTIVLLVCVHCLCVADENQQSSDFLSEIKQFEFRVDGNRIARLQPQPVLNWVNPARNQESGSVFVWIDGVRPVAIGTAFTYTYNGEVRRKNAFHTLTEKSIMGTHRGRSVWNTIAGNFSLKPVPNVDAPAPTTPQRSRQLKLLARRFQVNVTHRDGRREDCRLVPNPLYRFESKDVDQSGAIFSYAIGTDPEALLLLTQESKANGGSEWQYAFARFTFYPLDASFDGNPIWKAEMGRSMSASILEDPVYQKQDYITFRAEVARIGIGSCFRFVFNY